MKNPTKNGGKQTETGNKPLNMQQKLNHRTCRKLDDRAFDLISKDLKDQLKTVMLRIVQRLTETVANNVLSALLPSLFI